MYLKIKESSQAFSFLLANIVCVPFPTKVEEIAAFYHPATFGG